MKNSNTPSKEVAIKILHLEDVYSDAELVERELKKSKLHVEIRWVTNKRDFEKALGNFNPDIVLSDHSLPAFNSVEALYMVKEIGKNIPFILITSTVSEEFAVEMMREGVADYILKDRMQRLPNAVFNAITKWRLEKQKQRYIDKLIQSEVRFRLLIENSQEMITLMNSDGTMEYISPNVERTFGYTAQENKHRNVKDLVHPDDIKNAVAQMNEALKCPGVPFSWVIRNKKKDGSYLWVEGTLTNLLQVDGINAIVANFRNITKHLQAEQALNQSENYLKTLFDTTDTGYCLLDLNFNVLSYNYKSEEFIAEHYNKTCKIGDNIFDYFNEERRTALSNMFQEAINGQEINYEVYYPNMNSKGKWFSSRIIPITNEFKKTTGIMMAFTDITTRKEKEVLVSQSKANLVAIMESTEASVFSIDKNLRYITFNTQVKKAVKEIYGIEIESGSEVAEFLAQLTDEEAKLWYSIYAKALNGETLEFTIDYSRLNVQKHTKFNINPIWENQQVIGFSCFAQDITKQIIAEKEIRLNNRALESAVEGIIISGLIEPDSPIIYVNEGFCKITGYEKEDVLGKDCKFLQGKDTNENTIKQMRKCIDAKTYFEGEILNYKKDGTAFWNFLRITPVPDTNGNITHFVGFINDVSAKKLAEKVLHERNEQLSKLSAHIQDIQEKERTDIAREIHDELGQQLTSLKMDVSWLKNKTLNELPELHERTLSMIQVVNETITTVRRIATELRPGILDDLGLVAALEWKLNEFKKNTAIKFTFTKKGVSENYKREINTTVFRIFQESLTNITRHAEATEITTKLFEQNKYLVIEVADNGKGITDERLNNKTSLGLLGMKERASKLGGELTIKRLKQGTGLTLKIPL